MNPSTPTPQQPLAQGSKSGPAGKMSNKKFWLIIVALLALIVISAGALIYTQTVGQAPTEEQLSEAQVSITADGFSPSTIQIKKGQSVVWSNTDESAHLLTSDTNDSSIKSETLNKGDEYSTIFDEPGTYPYYDQQDPQKFKGNVIVE